VTGPGAPNVGPVDYRDELRRVFLFDQSAGAHEDAMAVFAEMAGSRGQRVSRSHLKRLQRPVRQELVDPAHGCRRPASSRSRSPCPRTTLGRPATTGWVTAGRTSHWSPGRRRTGLTAAGRAAVGMSALRQQHPGPGQLLGGETRRPVLQRRLGVLEGAPSEEGDGARRLRHPGVAVPHAELAVVGRGRVRGQDTEERVEVSGRQRTALGWTVVGLGAVRVPRFVGADQSMPLAQRVHGPPRPGRDVRPAPRRAVAVVHRWSSLA
jgi:hypothetical protein